MEAEGGKHGDKPWSMYGVLDYFMHAIEFVPRGEATFRIKHLRPWFLLAHGGPQKKINSR